MSVIDKMLRDLDRRQSAGTAKKAGQEGESRLARGTLLVDAIGPDPDALAKASPTLRTMFGGLVLLLLRGLVVLHWLRLFIAQQQIEVRFQTLS